MSDHRGAAFPPSSPSSSGGVPGGESAPPSEAALRALREQRGEIAQRIGEHLYRMIMGGLLHDPAVIAACRPLYEMEQRILRMEVALGTSGAGAAPLTQTALPVALPVREREDRDEMDTAITPGHRPAWQSDSQGSASSESEDRPEGMLSGTHRVHTPRNDDRVCGHCRTPLKAIDRVCPVCGRDTTDAVSLAATPVESTQCVRCGTALRAQDHMCPVCGTARTR